MKGVYFILVIGLGAIALLVYNSSGARTGCSFMDTLFGKCGG